MILANINGTETMMSPERVQGFLFRKMKAIAEEFLEHDVTNIFVPVPSNYNEVQRQAVKNSALEANLTVLRFIEDSSAAIMAYGVDRTDDERLVLVYEIGTSGSHASVASIEQGFIEPLGTTIDSFGGEFFTNQVADVFMADFEQQHKVEGQRTDESFRRLRDAVEEAKQNISTQIAPKIEIVDLVGGLSFVRVLTASDFVTINDAYLDLKAVRQLLDDLSLSAKDIDDVILVGGSAHIPEIQNQLEGFFEGNCPLQGISLDNAIVIGTAMQGAALSAEEPTSACFFGIDSYPLSVGVNTAGGIFKRIIPRKTLLPVRRAQNFTTAVDGQSSMLIQVFEGEHTGNKTKMVMDILERDRVLDQGF
ncbi:glucose-regulated protein [Seiridium cupressi]